MSGNIGEKARAAFLALIMVTSVMAAGVAFSGSAAAEAPPDSPTDDPGDLQVSLLNGSTGTVNTTFGVNTTSGTINVTNATAQDVQVANIDPSTESTKAIQFAVDNATAENDTIRIGPGSTYNGTVDITTSGVTVEGNGDSAEDVEIEDVDISNDEVTLQEVSVVNPASDYLSTNAIDIENDGSDLIENVTIQNTIISGGVIHQTTGTAPDLRGLTLDSNEFDQDSGPGSVVAFDRINSTDTTITNNEFNVTDGSAFDAIVIRHTGADDVGDYRIENNLFTGVTTSIGGAEGAAIHTDLDDGTNQETTIEIIDNTFRNNQVGVSVSGNTSSVEAGNSTSDNISIEDNTFENHSLQAIEIGTSAGELSISNNQIDQGSIGVSVDAGGTANINIDDTTINGTDTTGIDIAGVNTDAAVNVTNSELTENEEGVRLSASNSDAQVNIHFNTFEENVVGIAEDGSGDDEDAVHNATFNDFVNNEDAAVDLNGGLSGTLNANYSYWGDWDFLFINCTYTPQTAQLGYDQSPGVYEYTRIHTEERG